MSISAVSNVSVGGGCVLRAPGHTALDLTNSEIRADMWLDPDAVVEGTIRLAGAVIHGTLALRGQLSQPERRSLVGATALTVERASAVLAVGIISSSDVWVFGEPDVPGANLGAWHYNGRSWSQVASGHGLEGGSGLSASDIWAFDGADVAHWNGSTWSRKSLASLLPAKHLLNDPALTGIFEQSRHSVYAIANGQLQDEGGPLVLLHWNGSAWSKVAGGNFGFGELQQVSSDGHGGLWLPMPAFGGQKSYLLHYSNGRLTQATLPGGTEKTTVNAVALIPGTTQVLGAGDVHAAADSGSDVVGVILQYEI